MKLGKLSLLTFPDSSPFLPYFMEEILDCKTITEMCLCVVEIDICDAYR